MPVYNCDQFLEYAMDSIISQSYDKWELICIDDGSTDKSLELLHKYEAHDKRIKVYTKKNEGVSSARNDGLKYAKGDIISFIDADDYIAPNTYENVISIIKKTDCDICIVGLERVYSFGSKDTIELFDPINVDFFNLIDKMNNSKSDIIGGVVNKFYKRNVLESIFFDKDVLINEDMLFNSRVMSRCDNIQYLSGKYYKYYVGNMESASKNVFYSQKGFKKLQTGIIAYDRMLDISLNRMPLYANQGIMYMNLLFIMYNLKIEDAELCDTYLTAIRKRIRYVLKYDGVDIKHKLVYFIACINYKLAFYIKKIGLKISK